MNTPFIEHLLKLRESCGCTDTFKSAEEFEQFMLMYQRGFMQGDKLPFDYKKAHILQEIICDLQENLNIEDRELNEMLSYIVGSAV